MFKPAFLRAALLASACAFASAGPALAQEQTQTFNIAPGDLGPALEQYMRQAGVELVYSQDAVAGKSTPGLQGAYSREEALERLLAGSGLQVRRDASGAVLVASAVAPAELPDTESAADGHAVADIVVTANRRNQDIQEAPLTVEVVTAETLSAAGVTSSRDLQNLVPGLTFNNGLTAGVPYIRGVGQNTGSVGVESPIATYLDGVYLVAPASGLFSFNNIDQIEVAKGPQGTLFGRNTTGGVIQIRTRRPSHTTSMDAHAGYGNYETVSLDFYGTTGVTDDLATSLSLYGSERMEGFGRNLSLGIDVFTAEEFGIQNKWLWTPTNNTDVELNLLYSGDYGWQGSTHAVFPGHVANDGVTTHVGDYDTMVGIETPNRGLQSLAALTIEHDLGWARIRNILAYHDLQDTFHFVQNAIPINASPPPAITQHIYQGQQTWTEEFHILSPDNDRFQWIAGLFLLHDETQLDQFSFRDNQFVTGSSITFARQAMDSYAAFGEVTFSVLPETNLTLGVRYTSDEKEVTGISQALTAGGLVVTTPAAPGGTSAPLRTPETWEEFTYRAVLDHNFTPDAMGYLSYNRGFKSGLYNISVFTNQPVEPEFVDAYEAGLKTEWFDNRLRLNTSVFFYDYQAVQLRQVVSAFPGQFVLFNAANAEVSGLDLSFNAVPTSNLTIFGGFELLDAKYVDFPGAPFAIPNPVTLPLPAGCVSVGALPPSSAFLGGNTTVSCDLSGSRMIRSPEFTGNLGFTYVHVNEDNSEVALTLSDHYNSGFSWDADGLLKQDAYHDLSASLGWTSATGGLTVSLWGTNLLDERIDASASAGATSTRNAGEPRLFGIRVGVHH